MRIPYLNEYPIGGLITATLISIVAFAPLVGFVASLEACVIIGALMALPMALHFTWCTCRRWMRSWWV